MNDEAFLSAPLNAVSHEFWCNVGHELRGPLSTILAHVETLEQGVFGELMPRQAAALKPIHGEVKTIIDLINDLVSVVTGEAAPAPQAIVPCQPAEMVQRVLTILAAPARRRSIEWLEDSAPHDLVVLAEATKLERIIAELAGLTMLMVPARSQLHFTVSYSAGALILEVQRLPILTGQAQSALLATHLPDPGVLGHAMKIRPLSCMVLAQLLHVHGGTWAVHRCREEVSAMSIHCPLPCLDANPVAPAQGHEALVSVPPASDPIGAEPPRVLIADDQPALVSVTRHYLENLGYVVSVATDGRQAVDMAIQLQPDLILMDVQMPLISGLDAIRLIRASGTDRLKSIPIISLSGLTSSADRARCLAAGANECLMKPFGIREIDELIRAFLSPSDRAKEADLGITHAV